MKKRVRIQSNRSLPARIRRALEPLLSVATAAVLLRVFLGGTMLYAGLDKFILDPRFLQSSGVGSIGETLRAFVAANGPLSALVESLALNQPIVIGAAIGATQLAVGALLLTGSWVRFGALIGAGISLALALTASWGVTPYYYGNDLPYLVAFLALAAVGDGGVFRLGAPVVRGYDPQRRAAMLTGGGVLLALLALLALDRSRFAALLAQSGGSDAPASPGASAGASETPSTSATPGSDDEDESDDDDDDGEAKSPKPSESANGGSGGGGGTNGTVIQGAEALRPDQALNFSAGGTAAVLLKDGNTYRAFERACTHQGTNVDWEPANGSFYCSNHGARFSSTGDAIVGPARTPLRPITVSVAADGSVSYTR
jgi:thiosulfate dehydrogenase [quinone] large subunit